MSLQGICTTLGINNLNVGRQLSVRECQAQYRRKMRKLGCGWLGGFVLFN